MVASASNNRSMGSGPPNDAPNRPRGRGRRAHTHERRETGKWAAAILAFIVHLALLVLIVVGVSWQVKAPAPVVAEMWDQLPPVRNAPATPTPPPPEPPVEQPSPPTPQPIAPKVLPPTPVPEKAPPGPTKADIALKVEREAKERKLKEQAEAEAADKKKKEQQLKTDADRKKVEEDRKKIDEDRKKAETERKKREDEVRKDDARRMEAEDRTRQAQAQQDQQARMAREQAQRAAADAYGAKIRDLIRSRANVPDTVTGKPKIQVRLRLLVNGAVLDASVVTPSGNRVYDEAIERAINGIMQWPLPDNVELLGGRRELILKIESEN